MIARGIGLFFTSALLTGFIWMMPVTEVKTRCDYSPAEAIAAAYVQVNGDAGTGSGVCVGEYVVTARHVTEASDEVTLKRGDEDQMHTVIGDVIFQSDEADLAVIKPRYPVHGSQPATLSTTPLARGETVWYCGTTIGIHGCIEKSIVNLPKYTKDKHSYFAVNGGGCAGIGQACPGSKMGCSLSDAGCQLAYFESYALGRYGSWEAAYQFWIGHGWW